ncbi:hypothetical protein Pint_00205 [Pistacia integerrima]|uniref:Uncharacterized protein n=1 Tax=Pistacia integerrima TaxID=434235 RepID=A0ACC0ZL17_9ROSI|nr:hypothetical protein Pint_00205 [Pistacia integerrima]
MITLPGPNYVELVWWDFGSGVWDSPTLGQRTSRKYSWVTEIKNGIDRKYSWVTEIENGVGRKQSFLAKVREKKKELSPQDAALNIRRSFKEHVVRGSQALDHCASWQWLLAKAWLKEVRVLFYNFQNGQQISRDAEESQWFYEKIIVLILTEKCHRGEEDLLKRRKLDLPESLQSKSNRSGGGRGGSNALFLALLICPGIIKLSISV